MNRTAAQSQALPNTGRDRPIRHLNQIDLARRWNLSPRTLERWRWLKSGPPFLKIGGRVVYRLDDIEQFESSQMRQADRHTGQ